MKRPQPGRPRRSLGREQPRRVIKVHSEGRVTEPAYLLSMAKTHRIAHVEIGSVGKDPLSLVNDARQDAKLLTRRRQEPEFDEVWVIFDTDEHPNIPRACAEALDAGIGVAVSNPCFELWLILHCRDQTGPLERREAQRHARDLELIDGKDIHPDAHETFELGYATARDRARSLDKRHEASASGPRANPSSSVWKLADRLRQSSSP
ncbi:MAG: RloB family protein [bacterium]|nr:RloB family protein [bacterium]